MVVLMPQAGSRVNVTSPRVLIDFVFLFPSAYFRTNVWATTAHADFMYQHRAIWKRCGLSLWFLCVVRFNPRCFQQTPFTLLTRICIFSLICQLQMVIYANQCSCPTTLLSERSCSPHSPPFPPRSSYLRCWQ